MRVLVTGGSGRFAEWVVKALRPDHDLVLFSRTPPPEDRADLPWIQGDLNNLEDCRRAVEGVEAIQHLGAVPSPSDHPLERLNRQRAGQVLPPLDATMHTNIMGTYYLLQAAVQAEVATVNILEAEYRFLNFKPFWITANDDRVCEICGPRHMKEIEGEDFPPAHVNCRCEVFYDMKVDKP